MKINLLLYVLIFSQIITSQNTSVKKQFIEVEITKKQYVDAKDKSNPEIYEGTGYINTYSSGYNRLVSKNKTVMIFDLNGNILQRKGYQIKKNRKSKPSDLIEIYNYQKNGLLSNILEQTHVNNKLLEKTFLQQFYYNDKKQLTSKTLFDFKRDSVVKITHFQYDINGNNIKIASDSLHYIIKEYDANNQILSCTSFKDKVINYNTDEKVKTGYAYYDNNTKMLKINFAYTEQFYPNGLLKESEKSNDNYYFKQNKKYSYSDNGLLKSLAISNSYYIDNYLLQQEFTTKSDFKEALNRKVTDLINNQICTGFTWE